MATEEVRTSTGSGTTKLTLEKKQAFCRLLCEEPNVTVAARAIDMSRFAMYKEREKDAEFAAAWDAAIEEGVDTLEQEAARRAFKGVSRGVYYQGERIDTVHEYSDVLAIFLLKAHRPNKYRESLDMHHSGSMEFTGMNLVIGKEKSE
jgi:hypothetical protein